MSAVLPAVPDGSSILAGRSDLYRELVGRECEHLVKMYMDLCQTDRSYNTILCGLVTIMKDDV